MSRLDRARWGRTLVLTAAAFAVTGGALRAQQKEAGPAAWSGDPPAIASLVGVARSESDLRLAVERYLLDQSAIERRYPVPYSPARQARLRALYDGWTRRLADTGVDALNPEGRIDYVLLRNRITFDSERLALAERRWTEMAPLLPFFDTLRALPEDRFDRKRADGRETATLLSATVERVTGLTKALAADGAKAGGLATRPGITPVIAARAATQVTALRDALAEWYLFYES